MPTTIGALLMVLLSLHVRADDSQRTRDAKSIKSNNPQVFGGKSLDDWIAQAKQASDLDDRHNAMQVLRNFGLKTDRAKTLSVFTDLLADEATTIRSLAAAGLKKAGRPTDPRALEKLVEILSEDLSHSRNSRADGELDAELGLLMRTLAALSVLGDQTHTPVVKRTAGNHEADPLLRQAAKSALRELEARGQPEPPAEIEARAIAKLKFLVGVWKSVSPANAPPSPETRTITIQPDRLGLTITTESVLGKHVASITYDVESQEYVLTHTTADGEKIVNHAKLVATSRLEGVVSKPPGKLLSGGTFIVTVADDSWTETVEWPGMKNQASYERSFVRQQQHR